jgi:MYXO-CTERM domain-containing protein
MDDVAVTGFAMTRYSIVIWPALRRFRLSFAPTPTTPATQGRYVTVDWNEIFLAGTPFESCNASTSQAPVGPGVLLLGLLGFFLVRRWLPAARRP